MTLLRRFLVLIVAVGIAFAVGVALGGGPLQGDSDDDGVSLAGERDDLQRQVAALKDARVFDEAVSRFAAQDLIRGRLGGRTVTLVVLPGTSDEIVARVRSTVQSAGAKVAVTAYLHPDLLDPAKKTYVDSVATNSIAGQADLERSVTGETYDRIGTLFARAYVGRGDNTAFDETATELDSELRGANLVDVEGKPGRRGSAVLVVGPAVSASASALEARRVIETALVRSLVEGGDGLVLIQPDGVAGRPGLAAALAADPRLGEDRSWSTIDVVVGSAAQVGWTYALATALDDRGGTYGIVDDEALLPPGLTTPTD